MTDQDLDILEGIVLEAERRGFEKALKALMSYGFNGAVHAISHRLPRSPSVRFEVE